jgi:ketol-acid reductoisomerase
MSTLDAEVIGSGLPGEGNGVDNRELIRANQAIRNTMVEMVGEELRSYMGAMQPIA